MLTDAELNALIAEVERDVVSLAKSQTAEMKKDDQAPMDEEPVSEEAAEQAAAPAGEAPAPEAPAPEAGAPEAPMEEPAMEEPAMEAAPEDDQAPMDPAMAEDGEAPMSLEQLAAVYGDMDEQELEMHYEALKQALQKCWMKQSMTKDEYPTDKKANGGEIKSGASMAKEEKAADEKPEDKKDAEMDKSEHIAQLEASVESLVKALETKLPARKSFTEVNDTTPAAEPELKGKDLQTKALELTKNALAKNEREMLNSFFVTGQGEAQVRELVKSKKA